MRGFFIPAIRALTALSVLFALPAAAQEEGGWSIAIHGGAGTIARENMTAEQDAAYRAALQRALDAGATVLREGGSAMDAIQAAIEPMEDDPLFNAGRGAVLTWDGDIELDASIMDGRTRDAGAVAGVTGIRHPIELARKVMTDSPHVMLAGDGAEAFAAEQGLELMPPEWFETERRRDSLERMKAQRLSALDVDVKFGTVGAVALDRDGNMAAGTSTGGMTGKRWGRIGDAPIIGAGTYADNRACAVSATGWGEFFIRVGVAHEICTRLRYRYRAEIEAAQATVPLDEEGMPTYIVHASEFGLEATHAQEEIDAVIAEVGALGGDGGVIVVTSEGYPLFSMNTSGMYRGRATSDGVNEVAIYADE
ncbi:MAG: isoaspartyl peptidase/L-asparaginase [Erythrobacter sp.]|uniref:isoaspartyl peptidase/L-asparaginase family protein n=1 Tax=Erythrobacter sp. TaxID=1042 RepID=UPI001AFE1A4A|nr:isoaspartyl peptidase/L-asparaginase [Erythrobacter sp.]MBO6766965.1 isoaspartyl peptidase/L-asparaginase [Erythrobacter sp.]